MVKKYRKMPIQIEAIQYTGKNYVEVEAFVPEGSMFYETLEFSTLDETIFETNLYIETLEGDMYVSKNDYIIKGIQGEFYPCKPDIFEATYEKA